MQKPLVILVGSASGIGKSTVSAEIAKRLEIKHLIESDFIRAVVRGIIGSDYAPALHESSYNAYKILKDKTRYDDYEDLVSAGFDAHASFVIPALEKVIKRAINDYDDIILEGVHLVPGLINIEQFKDRAEIYFFILASDEESHKERFVKRAVQIHRGGKQLDHFTENRIIHDYLIKQARLNNVNVIWSKDVESTLQKMLRIINKSCTNVLLSNTIDELKEVTEIIIGKYNGSIEKIEYELEDIKTPLVREVNINETKQTEKFIKSLNSNPEKKKDLQKLYDLTKYRKNKICAANQEILDKIIKELNEKGFTYNEAI